MRFGCASTLFCININKSTLLIITLEFIIILILWSYGRYIRSFYWRCSIWSVFCLLAFPRFSFTNTYNQKLTFDHNTSASVSTAVTKVEGYHSNIKNIVPLWFFSITATTNYVWEIDGKSRRDGKTQRNDPWLIQSSTFFRLWCLCPFSCFVLDNRYDFVCVFPSLPLSSYYMRSVLLLLDFQFAGCDCDFLKFLQLLYSCICLPRYYFTIWAKWCGELKWYVSIFAIRISHNGWHIENGENAKIVCDAAQFAPVETGKYS